VYIVIVIDIVVVVVVVDTLPSGEAKVKARQGIS
jgi:hypothetical protein